MVLFFACYLFFCWRWRVLFEFRNCGIHFVPRLSGRNENIHLRLKPTPIPQGASQDSHKRRIPGFEFGTGHSRSAVGTKTAFVFASPDAGCEMVTQLSARQSEGLCRYQYCRSESAASHSLAISTMTFEHHDWIGRACVANRAAGTTTGKGYFHVLVITQFKDNDLFVLILAALPAALALSGD